MRFEKFLRVSFFLCAISYNYFVNTVYFCVLRIYLMSYNLLSDCFICDLQLLLSVSGCFSNFVSNFSSNLRNVVL